MEVEPTSVRTSKPRGRPSHKQKVEPASVEQSVSLDLTVPEDGTSFSEQLNFNADDEQLSPFSSYLRHTLRLDHAEIARIANELDVAENTIYRWLNGSTDPRPIHLKKLLEVLPQHRNNLIYAINVTFPGVLDSLSTGVREVQKDIYQRVLELVTTIANDDDRRWQVTQTIFEHALLHLDAERQGLAITYAQLIHRHEDGFHSLYEVDMRGTYPWPFTLECKAYLGSTTLAGRAAMTQRMQTWDDVDDEGRLPVVVDEFEQSACAYPLMHAGRIAGVLIVSSTQTGFFTAAVACQTVVEYARLLALGLKENEFYPPTDIHLKPMPDLQYQREEISNSYMNRVVVCARKRKLTLPEAEECVRRDMEEEFAEIGSRYLEERGLKEVAYNAALIEQSRRSNVQ